MKYLYLVDLYQRLESTSKRLEKTFYLSEFLKECKTDDIPMVLLLLQGRLYPSYDESKLGVAARLVVKAIEVSSGLNQKKIEDEWKKTGDLGITAENLIKKKTQATLFSQNISVLKVFKNLRKLAELGGQGTVDLKVKLIAELLGSAQPAEARYVVRTVLEELRVGIAEGAIRDAIVLAFFPKVVGFFFKCKCGSWMPNVKFCLKCGEKMEGSASAEIKKFSEGRSLKVSDVSELKDIEDYDFIIPSDDKVGRDCYNYLVSLVESATEILNDLGEVALLAKEKGRGGLLSVKLKVGRPVKLMLYPKAKDVSDALSRVGRPCAFEYKYDGFRLQIHKLKGKITLYTRRLEDVTKQFPEVVSFIAEHVNADNFIIDSEAVGYDPKTKKYLPFQKISQRIRRKYDIERMAEEFPVELTIFDIIFHDGADLLKVEFQERRAIIEKIVEQDPKKIVLAKQVITDEEDKAEAFYQEALDEGQEGVMAKNLKGIYKPGARVGYGMKIKPVMETLDLAIVGAEWGEGKRATWLTSFTLVCRDDYTGDLLEIGKVGTGFKELETEEGVSFKEMTELLKPLIVSENGKSVRVKSKVIIEVSYEEIQKSTTYSSGYALRFPRVIRLREVERDDVSPLSLVEDLFTTQKGRG